MTSIGLKILSIFSRCLHDVNLLKRKNLTEREIHVLTELFNWEEPISDIEVVLASELNLSRERIRQIGVKALKKMRRIVNDDPMKEMNSIIKSYANSNENDDLLKTTVRLCSFEMEELPTLRMVKLVVCLCIPFKRTLRETMDYCKLQKELLDRETRNQLRQIRTLAKKNKEFADLLSSHVIWFDNVKFWKKQQFVDRQPKRRVIADPRYHSGVFYSSKIKKDVQYESHAELQFIEKLESADIVEYYLEQPITINYQKKNKDHIYTPDFAVLLKDGSCFLAEIKASPEDILDSRVHRDLEQLIHFCKQHGFGFLLHCGKRSFNYWMNCPIDKNLENIIVEKLAENGGRIIFLNEFKTILEQTGALKRDALTLVFRNNWGYYPFPFKLTPKNPYCIFRDVVIEKYFKT
ncbi:MAG: TnsA endonuclease N-terminal domain-containing protein [Sphingobacterium sp.]|jgi:hypothetical protein|nr:TnsA endonuclease N-terminal domain-containing protein [Sphingobacterium sp.]